MSQELTYAAWTPRSISLALFIGHIPSRTSTISLGFSGRFLVLLDVFLVPRPHPSRGIILSLGPLTLPISLVHFFEAEWDLSGSLPLRPVSEEGIGILKADVVVLREGNVIRQVLGMDEVALGPL